MLGGIWFQILCCSDAPYHGYLFPVGFSFGVVVPGCLGIRGES